ncbi:MAG: hypothetical protein DDG60_13435 [Anaerolineae bacterium]|nr:MAG: hypothetical protein DDG60_13435 [Anaerolineae bacterium]
MRQWIEKTPSFAVFLLLLLLAGLTYLPHVGHFGFYKDDWYLMYAARVRGPEFFSVIFAGDRPARAPLQAILYILFGEHLLYYHLSAFLYRVVGALALWGSFTLLWPAQKRAAWLASVLFLLYPGFLSQVNAVDFQAHLFSLMTAMFSLWLGFLAWRESRIGVRLLLLLLTILTGWLYLSLMEYFIGIEVLRFGLLGMVAWRETSTLRKYVARWMRRVLPFLLVPVGFLFWRLLLFESERRATDVGAQLSALFHSPLTGVWWLVYLVQDVINVLVSAWVVPLYTLAFDLRLRDFFPALALGLLTAALVLWISRLFRDEQDDRVWQREALVVGLLAVLGGLFPVIFANRHINFSDYSRYTLPALAGAVLLMVAWLSSLPAVGSRLVVMAFLITGAVMTHYANSVIAIQEAAATRNFWWQVAWRIPALKPGTTLVADYPSISMQEDYFIWGPANQIYFPQPQQTSEPYVQVPLPAVVLNAENLPHLLVQRGQREQIRRGIQTQPDYRQILILSQPAENACVRVINGQAPEFSQNDRVEIRLLASASRLENILLDRMSQPPPQAYFGAEPVHDWCYYYQKADLARQAGDWARVIQLVEQALEEGHYPSDKIEWLPLMQAYTVLGRKQELRRFISIMAESPYIQQQVCVLLSRSAPDLAMRTYIEQSFCK